MLMDTVTAIASWMDTIHLKLNSDNTEFIMFGYRRQLVKCAKDSVSISDSAISRSPSVKYLGVSFDENLSLKDHIILKCRKAMANFVMICNISKFLTNDAGTTLILAFASVILTMQMLYSMVFWRKQFHIYKGCICRCINFLKNRTIILLEDKLSPVF